MRYVDLKARFTQKALEGQNVSKFSVGECFAPYSEKFGCEICFYGEMYAILLAQSRCNNLSDLEKFCIFHDFCGVDVGVFDGFVVISVGPDRKSEVIERILRY